MLLSQGGEVGGLLKGMGGRPSSYVYIYISRELFEKMSKRSVDDVLDRLLRALLSATEPLSTREVARRSGVEWRTAEKFLSRFHEFSGAGSLVRIREPKLTLWRLEPAFREVLKVRVGRRDAEWAGELAERMKEVSPEKGLRMVTELSNSAMRFHGSNRIKKFREEDSGWRELRLLRIE